MPGDTADAVCFTIHVSESPEQRLEQMQSVQHVPSPGCITAGGREQPQPQQALGIQRHELPGPARSSPQTSSLKAGRLLPWGKH